MPGELKFPVCNKSGKLDCGGMRAAFSRARQTHRPAVARKAIKMACRRGCPWTRAENRCAV